MHTDTPPRKADLKAEYARSDAMGAMALPAEDQLRTLSEQLEQALASEDRAKIEKVCNAIAVTICGEFGVVAPQVKVLGVRPLEESGGWVDETFGDYHFETMRIRLWMRTAVLEKVTSFGTFLSTLCHELCHHLDVVQLDLPHTYHTRGFYARAGLLYHHVRGTPVRELVWDKQTNGTYRINWPKTMAGSRTGAARRGG